MVAGTAAADTISLKGKKIDSEADVVVDGVKIGTAILIEGKSYAPVRVIGEAAGFNVDFKDWTVVLETPSEKENKQVSNDTTSDIDEAIQALNKELKACENRYFEIRLGVMQDLSSYSQELIDEHSELEKKMKEIKAEIEKLKKLKEESSK